MSDGGSHLDIFSACWHGNLEAIQQFIRDSPSCITERDSSLYGGGYSPLHYAAYAGHGDVCALLVQHGARINERNDAGATALFLAAQQGHHDIVRDLLNAGADSAVHVRAGSGMLTALDVAADKATLSEFVMDTHSSGGRGDGAAQSQQGRYGPPPAAGVPSLTMQSNGIVCAAWAESARPYSSSSGLAVQQYSVQVLFEQTEDQHGAGGHRQLARADSPVRSWSPSPRGQRDVGQFRAVPAVQVPEPGHEADPTQPCIVTARIVGAFLCTERSTTLPRLKPGNVVRVRVAAVNAVGQGPWSLASLPARIKAVPAAPAAPAVAGVHWTHTGQADIPMRASVVLEWSSAAAAATAAQRGRVGSPAASRATAVQSWLLEVRSAGADGQPLPSAMPIHIQQDVQQSRAEVVNLIPGGTYVAVLCAQGAHGNSAGSTPLLFTVPAEEALGPAMDTQTGASSTYASQSAALLSSSAGSLPDDAAALQRLLMDDVDLIDSARSSSPRRESPGFEGEALQPAEVSFASSMG